MESTRLNDEEEDDAEWQRSAGDAHADDRHAGYKPPYCRARYEEACASGSERDFGEDEDDDEEEAGGMSVMDAFEDFNLRVRLLCVHMTPVHVGCIALAHLVILYAYCAGAEADAGAAGRH